ncbi:MAG: ABC transporter ATP-binding protein [Blautia sp.]|nr:ABC transporter ATP-binding protein [Blautia sp.]
MIEVKNLTKRYGNHEAVKDLSFRIEEGKIYGLLGPNGAGKSTTMNMITGYIAATSGTVLINGHDILEEPEQAKKQIGYLPELPPLYQDMTVLEYLDFAADLKKVKPGEKKEMLEEIMALVQISDMKGRLIKNLSKGYKQRVGLAQALMGYPQILILDEPTVGLDPKQIIEIRDLIKGLGKNHTVILSSHILSEVSAICDEIMIIANGELVASDTPESLEKKMAGENTLDMVFAASDSEVKKMLEEIPEIQEMEIVPEEGETRAILHTASDVDIRKELFHACVRYNCPILQMSNHHASLEDIFLELTAPREPASQGKEKKSLFRKNKKQEQKQD